MIGFQAMGAAPIFYDRMIDKAGNARLGHSNRNPASWQQARGPSLNLTARSM